MTREEYCAQVLSQLRRLTEDERRAVRQELADHMEDHICDFLDLGYEESLAEERTLALMGDPSEVGRALNEQYPRGWLILGRIAVTVTALLCIASLFSLGMLGFVWESLTWRIWPPEIRTSLEVEHTRELDIRVPIGNDVLYVYRVSLGRKDGEYLAETLLCGYDRIPGGIVSRHLLSGIRAENQRGEPWQGGGSGGGGHWLGEYVWKRASIQPGDDHITLRYEHLGETVLIDIPLPEGDAP